MIDAVGIHSFKSYEKVLLPLASLTVLIGANAAGELARPTQRDITLLLPVATVYETGNHIAKYGSGGQKRSAAQKFIGFVQAGFSNLPPWTPTPLPNQEQMSSWLAEFPARAAAGIGLGDLSIIKTFEEQCDLHPNARVRIWTYDSHLYGYDRQPIGSLAD